MYCLGCRVLGFGLGCILDPFEGFLEHVQGYAGFMGLRMFRAW